MVTENEGNEGNEGNKGEEKDGSGSGVPPLVTVPVDDTLLHQVAQAGVGVPKEKDVNVATAVVATTDGNLNLEKNNMGPSPLTPVVLPGTAHHAFRAWASSEDRHDLLAGAAASAAAAAAPPPPASALSPLQQQQQQQQQTQQPSSTHHTTAGIDRPDTPSSTIPCM